MSQFELAVHPEANLEYDGFVNADRSTAYDVGSHFRLLESITSDGLPEGKRAVHVAGDCRLYQIYGQVLRMFIAVRGETLVLIQLSKMGGEHEEAQALERAIERMREYFGL